MASPSVSDEQRKDPSSPKDGDVDPLPDDWEMNDNDSDNEVHKVLHVCTVNCKCLLNFTSLRYLTVPSCVIYVICILFMHIGFFLVDRSTTITHAFIRPERLE